MRRSAITLSLPNRSKPAQGTQIFVGTALAIAAALCVVAAAGAALAHGSERGFVLLLPTGYYLVGGAVAVAATFVLLVALPRHWTEALAAARARIFAFRPPSPVVTSLLSFLLLALLVAAGMSGSHDPLANPLPLAIWTVWWVGFTLLSALFGHLWAYVNPWTGPCRLTMRLSGRRFGQPALIGYPRRLGYWPAVVLFLGFAWFELIDLAPDNPERLAVAVAVYWLATFVALILFGEEAWLGRAEPFSVFFGFISRLSPFVWEPAAGANGGRRRLSLAVPGAALLGRDPLPVSGVLFILVTLASVSFDGLSKTFWWLGLNGINPLEFPGRSAVVGINSVGLVLMWFVLACGYFGAVWAAWRLSSRETPLGSILGTLVFSIMPISLGYHFSHYLTALLVNGQYAYAAASDPFATGLDLLGRGHFRVTTSFLNTYEGSKAIWNAQTAGLVAGHVLGVVLAHLLAARSGQGYWSAIVSQIPLVAVMVLYTLFGLWLLSTPVAG